MNYLLFLQFFQEKYATLQNKVPLFHFLREELQYLILLFLFSKVKFPITFMGGTFLRLSYKINRFSEDIDLVLDKPDPHFPFYELVADLENFFSEHTTGFKVKTQANTNRNVLKIMMSFSDILFDLKLSPLPSQTIKIKIEIDSNPPPYAKVQMTLYRSLFGDYYIQTFNLSTGFSGKVACILNRTYQKGRDYYDLAWYLEQFPRVPINLDFLNASLDQQNVRPFKTSIQVLQALQKKVKTLDIHLLKKDLGRFIQMDQASFQAWAENYIGSTTKLLKTYQQSL